MTQLLFLGNFGTGELLVIGLVVLLFFGGKKIPELMRGLGTGVKSFKDGMNGIEEKSKEQHRTDENKNNDDNKQA